MPTIKQLKDKKQEPIESPNFKKFEKIGPVDIPKATKLPNPMREKPYPKGKVRI